MTEEMKMTLKTRSMTRTIHAKTGHTLFVKSISIDELPANVRNEGSADSYSTFYVVRNFDATGHIFFYLAKGHKSGGKYAKEIVGWYPATGAFWASYGLNLEDAIEGMQRDGWMYA